MKQRGAKQMGTSEKIIFIAEDDYDFLEQTTIFLTSKGYKVISAQNEKSALEMINKENFQLAVLDLMMDNQDSGFVLGYRIKQRDKNIPVILVTGVTRETGYRFDLNDKDSKALIKADAVLNKNIRFEQLQKEIERLLLS